MPVRGPSHLPHPHRVLRRALGGWTSKNPCYLQFTSDRTMPSRRANPEIRRVGRKHVAIDVPTVATTCGSLPRIGVMWLICKRRSVGCRMPNSSHVSVMTTLIRTSRKMTNRSKIRRRSISGSPEERLQIVTGRNKDPRDSFLTDNPEAVERRPCFEHFHPRR